MKKIYYEKVGRKYVPVSEYDSDFLDSFAKGTHLVISYPGGRSTRYNIDPNYAAMIAAGRVAEDAIADKIRQGSEAQPKQRPITEQQRLAWEKLKEVFDDEFFSLTLPAARDLADAGVKAMQDEAVKLMQHPSVKEAYEHFVFMAKLAYEDQKDKV
jgi:hypothetical protein